MKNKIVCLFAAALFAVSSANAAISLVIDADANQFWFNGSATGTLGTDEMNGDTFSELYWKDVEGTTSGYEVYAPGLSSAFTLTSSANPQDSYIYVYKESSYGLTFSMMWDSELSDGSVTITADNTVKFDYSTTFESWWDSTYESIFEGYVGSTLTLSNGNDFGNIAVVSSSAVPEPATYAGLAGLGALGLVLLRRRRK